MAFKAYTDEQLMMRMRRVVIDGYRHQDYQRTVDHARWCYRMMTGDDQDEILITYKRRESDEQKIQRVSVTNSRTQYVTNKVFNLFSEVHRSDRDVNDIRMDSQDDAQNVIASLQSNLVMWLNTQPLERWLDEQFRYLNFYDPNTFVVMEFDNSDPVNMKPTVYPFLVMSDAVMDFDVQRGVLQYLIARERITVPRRNKDDHTHVEIFTMYSGGLVVVMTRIPDDAVYEIQDAPGRMIETVTIDEHANTIVTETMNNGLDFTPAIRFGYLRDPMTKGRTYVTPMWPAEKILTDLIWKKSEYDLAHALHGFYQKFIYVDDCPTCDATGEIVHPTLPNIGNVTCPTCQGSGINHHTTTQDIIEVLRVESRDQHIPLSEMVHYEQIPMDLIRQQKEDLRDLERDSFNAIFGSNVLERSEIATTATEKNYDWRAVNNTLLPYADKYTSTYKFLVYGIASIRQERDGLVVEYAFPGSFNLESLNDLLNQRKSAMDAGAPYVVTSAIDHNIVQKQHRDNPTFVQMYRAIESVRPFRDKDLTEKQFMVNMLPQDDPQRVLYLYFDEIIDDVTTNVPTFPMLSIEQRRAVVLDATNAKIESLALSRPQLFSGMVDDEPPGEPAPE